VRRAGELALPRQHLPAGTVLSTRTGILVPDEHALAEGDVVEITLERVASLRNPVRRLPA
jgi:hypothetical protein